MLGGGLHGLGLIPISHRVLAVDAEPVDVYLLRHSGLLWFIGDVALILGTIGQVFITLRHPC